MAKQSKFFRVAVEGDTVDGRVIERNWLVEMAASYNPATYSARVNMEHIRGITADKPFKAYGDILALKTDDVELELNGKAQKKLALFAQIDPTDDLVTINADRQKIFTSIEIDPNFAGTGKAYLMGLAVTDNPASLGTEALQFVAHRKLEQTNFFSAAAETKIEFVEVAEPATGEHAGLLAAATAFFKQFTDGKVDPKPKEEPATPPAPANDNDMAARFAAFGQGMEKIAAGIDAFTKKVDGDVAALRTEVTALKSTIDNTDGGGPRRPLASGGGNFTATDC